MTKIKDMVETFDKKENTMTIYFGDDGIAVAGNITKFQHVQGILALISSLTDHCGGDASVFNEAIKALREKEDEKKEEVEKGFEDFGVTGEQIKELLDLLKKAEEKDLKKASKK